MAPAKVNLAERAAEVFYYLKGGVSDGLESSSELLKALHLIGRNPGSNSLMNFWNSFAHSGRVSFGDFLKIVEQECDLDIRRLIRIFTKLSCCNRHGSVDAKLLKNILSTRGDFMSIADVDRILELYSDGKNLNYLILCSEILGLSRLGAGTISWVPESESRASNVDTRSAKKVDKVKAVHQDSLDDDRVDGIARVESGGMIYLDAGRTMYGHQFSLTLDRETRINIATQAIDQLCEVELLVFKEKDEERGRSLVASTQYFDHEGIGRLDCILGPGDYLLTPFTTGCHLNWRQSQPSEPLLLSFENNAFNLNPKFRRALHELFCYLDLDQNGTLNSKEFMIFCAWACGELPSQEEWQVVQSNFEVKNGELTEDGFIDLQCAQLEQNSDGLEDIWTMMRKHGFNNSLQMDQAVPYRMRCLGEEGHLNLEPKEVTSNEDLVERTLARMALEQGHETRIKNLNDLTLHTLTLPHRTTMVVRNKSHSKVLLRFDCSSSSNCISSRGVMDFTMDAQPRSTQIAVHLMAADRSLPFIPLCQETLIK